MAPAPPRRRPTPAPFETPQTHYAHSGDVNIAYQVVGDGPIDLVFVMGWVSHLEYFWTEPSFARFLRRLASFSRLILFDKRGTGLSDRVGALPTLEQRMDDVRAVMDAVGSRQAALLGVSEGGPLCALFATTYPERTRALVMIGTYAKRRWAPDYPWAPTASSASASSTRSARPGADRSASRRGRRASPHDPAFRDWWSTYLRMGASPGAALALTQMNAEIDVRDVLPAIRVPTLVLHRTGDRLLTIDEGRYVAARIPGASSSSCPATITCRSSAIRTRCSTRSSAFSATGTTAGRRRPRAGDGPHARGSPRRPASRRHAAFEAQVRADVERFRGRLLAFAPTEIQAAFDGPARAIRCAAALVAAGARAAARSGPGCTPASASRRRRDARRRRRPVERLARSARPGEVLVSRTVVDLVAGSGLAFEPRGAQPSAPTATVRRLRGPRRPAA